MVTALKLQKYIQVQVQLKFSYKYIQLVDKMAQCINGFRSIINHDQLFDFRSLRNSFARGALWARTQSL